MPYLRQLMIEELQLRNFAGTTIRSYIHGVEHFSRYFHRSPDQLGPEHIRKYQAILISKLKFSPNTVIQRLGALRFFYIKVLKKNWSVAETPYPRKLIRLPQILSPDEVTRLIAAADSTFHRAMLMTLYATGARRAEAAHLKVDDIDSKRMVVHIHGGKSIRDRCVMLVAVLVLDSLFEADLQPEQYAYRRDRSALDAVSLVHRLINSGHVEIVDADLTAYFVWKRTSSTMLTIL